MNKKKPIWNPSRERVEAANITQFIRFGQQQGILPEHFSAENYTELHQWSLSHKNDFWLLLWQFCQVLSDQEPGIAFDDELKLPGKGIDFSKNWFPDIKLNFAENLLKKGDPNTIAIIGLDELQRRRTLTYQQLNDAVAQVAHYLHTEGVEAGDRVAGYLPNIVESVIAMLATTYIGAIWSSCSPDFGVNAALDRFSQIEPKVLFYSDGYYYKGKEINLAERTKQLKNSLTSLQLTVEIPFLTSANPPAIPLPTHHVNRAPNDFLPTRLPFDHPLYILFSSGTTGKPKCIVHGVGGTLIQHLKELSLHTNLKAENNLFFFTTCGWMMWNWLVSALAVGSTITLFDGSPFYPKQDQLLNILEQEKISHFGASAKYFSELEKANIVANQPDQGRSLKHLDAILSTGSPLNPEQFEFIYRTFKSDLCLSSISGGTDIVSCFALGNPTLPVWPGELQCAGLGMDLEIYTPEGKAVTGQKGELVCHPPFPAMPLGFWNDIKHERFYSSYFEKFSDANHTVWAHGDYAEAVEHANENHIGYIIYGRSDATLNPGGVRIGTAEIYRQVEAFEEVLESIAIGQQTENDVQILLFVRLQDKLTLDEELINKLKKQIRAGASPRHVPSKIIQAPDLPRTFSGKLTELAVKNILHGLNIDNRDAIANPESLNFFHDLYQKINNAPS